MTSNLPSDDNKQPSEMRKKENKFVRKISKNNVGTTQKRKRQKEATINDLPRWGKRKTSLLEKISKNNVRTTQKRKRWKEATINLPAHQKINNQPPDDQKAKQKNN